MIHVCFCLYDKTGRYSKFTGTTMLSIFENVKSSRLPSVTVHILHDDTLTQDNREKFFYLAGQYNQLVKFYNIEKLCEQKLKEIKNIFQGRSINTVGTLYRLLISEIFSFEIEKVIYLDSDIIVNLDINELWQIELNDNIFAAVPELFNRADDKVDVQNTFPLCRDNLVKTENYFNAGVIFINLTAFRKEVNVILNWPKILDKSPRYGQFADQDILNYYFSARTLKLPLKFNRFPVFARKEEKIIVERKIYHYAGLSLGLGLDVNDPFNRLWLKYFIKTPWFDEETFGRLYESVRQMNVGLKNSMLQVSAMMSGKTRVFFTLSQNFAATRKIFSIRDDEEIISAGNPDSLQKLIDAMKLSKGKKVFFIVLQGFPFQILIQAGFVYGRDFFNGLDFLSEAHGVPFDSYQLVKAM